MIEQRQKIYEKLENLIEHGIPNEHIYKPDELMLKKIIGRVKLKMEDKVCEELISEIYEDYIKSIKKSIVEYDLLDSREKIRLNIFLDLNPKFGSAGVDIIKRKQTLPNLFAI